MRKKCKIAKVDAEFHSLLKSAAANNKKSIIQFTREIAKRNGRIVELFEKDVKSKKIKKKFEFRI